MRILVTNDDGVESPGIVRLAEDLRAVGDVAVLAPDGDRSAISHRISFHDPVGIAPVLGRSVRTYSCTGTPADCVVLGANELWDTLPDLLVSGINWGANLGDDINYSGTVAAAMEASVMGIPSIAISLAITRRELEQTLHWETATGLVVRLIREWHTRLPKTSFLNVNVPNVAPHEPLGVRVTRQGRKRYEDRLIRLEDDGEARTFRLTGRFDMRMAGHGSDLEAIRDGFASVTPISIDRTDEAFVPLLRAELETTGLSSRA